MSERSLSPSLRIADAIASSAVAADDEKPDKCVNRTHSNKWVGTQLDIVESLKTGKKQYRCTRTVHTIKEANALMRTLRDELSSKYEAYVLELKNSDCRFDGIPRAPKRIVDADEGVVYWYPDKHKKHMPRLVVKRGKKSWWVDAPSPEGPPPKSTVVGVSWDNSIQRWKGYAYHPFTGKQVDVAGSARFRRDQREECEEAVVKLRAEHESLKEAQAAPLIASNPLLRDLLRSPPNINDAEPGVAYCHLCFLDGYKPGRFIAKKDARGMSWVRVCMHPSGKCTNRAEAGKRGVPMMCITHGGGNRCSAEHCDEAGSYKSDKNGEFLCLSCLMYNNPTNKNLKTCVSREQFLAIQNELSFPEAAAEAIGKPECDKTIGTGASRRRVDMGWTHVDDRSMQPFKLVNECDEGGRHAHQSGEGCYSQDGQSGKWSGHMSDLGAVAISERDASWLDSQSLNDEEASDGVETHKAKKMKRILDGVLADQEAKMMPLRVVSLQVDEYVDCHGIKHGSAFRNYRVCTGDKRIKTVAAEWDHRYEQNLKHLKRLMAQGTEGPSFVHVRLFYDGCDPATGLPPPAR